MAVEAVVASAAASETAGNTGPALQDGAGITDASPVFISGPVYWFRPQDPAAQPVEPPLNARVIPRAPGEYLSRGPARTHRASLNKGRDRG